MIYDTKLTGALRMFRVRITKNIHICFMRNTSYMNGPKGYSITIMKDGKEKGTYQPLYRLLDNK